MLIHEYSCVEGVMNIKLEDNGATNKKGEGRGEVKRKLLVNMRFQQQTENFGKVEQVNGKEAIAP